MSYVHFSYGQCILKLKTSIEEFREKMEYFLQSNNCPDNNIITKLNSIKDIKNTVEFENDYEESVFERILELSIYSEGSKTAKIKQGKENDIYVVDEDDTIICIVSDNDKEHPYF